MTTTKPLEKTAGHSLVLIRLIGVTKLFKSLCLLALAVGLHYFIAPEKHHQIAEYVDVLRPDPQNHYLYLALDKLLSLKPETLQLLRVGSYAYSILFFIEAMGLFFDKGWAEWMVLITTAGFIPLEIIEICSGPSFLRVLIFVLNILILIYIAMRLRWRHLARLEARALGRPLKTPNTTPAGIKP